MDEGQSDLVIRRMLHDLRACVRAMRELPGWIRQDISDAKLTLPEMASESLDMLAQNAMRLDQYMVDLHSYARAGGPRAAGQADVKAAWARLASDMAGPAAARIELDVQVPVLPMEEGDFTSLLRILLDNALRHHDRDNPRVIIRTAHRGPVPVLEVEDDGPGIALEYQEKIFAFLEKLATRSEVPGSGVGLATARRLCSGHGAEISVENAAPRGARFVVSFAKPH